MLDSRLLRSDPEGVARNLARRGYMLDLQRFKALEERRKAVQVAADEVRASRNAHAKTVGRAKAQGEDIAPLLAQGEVLAEKLRALETDLTRVQDEFDALVLTLPNLLHESVPEGRDETANVELRRWGEPRKFSFEPRDHVAIGERLGSPEGELAIAQAVVFMACAAKSNAVYTAFGAAMADAREQGTLEVPLRLRNAPTGLMKGLGYGKGYRYAHDEPDAFAAGETYFPDGLPTRRYYEPVPRGLEIKIGEALARLRQK